MYENDQYLFLFNMPLHENTISHYALNKLIDQGHLILRMIILISFKVI